MASTLVRLSNQILLEYFYEEESYKIGQSGLRRVDNRYEDSITLVNDAITGNYSKFTVVNTNTDNVLLDENGTYHYYDENVNIQYKKVELPDYNLFKYNKIRVHIMSGYNFSDVNGFNINVYIEGEKKKLINLCNYVYLKSSTTQITFSPRPIKISESVFDKYVEFSILSLENLITLQETGSPILFALTDNKILQDHKLYIEYSVVNQIEYKGGFLTYSTLDTVKTVISSLDRYGAIENYIELSDDGSYFQFQARYNGRPIEDFIYQLNSVPGNQYYLMHQIRVVEQVGNAFIDCDEYTMIQKQDYEKLYRFRPVLYNKNVVSVSIDYDIKLINEVDGAGITKTGSVTANNVTPFQEKLIKLNVQSQPFITYNRISANNQNVISDNRHEILKTKVISTYITNNQIGSEDDKPISIIPFRNVLKISLVKDKKIDSSILSPDLVYYLIFIKNDQSKVYIKEVISDEVKKENGELLFIIEESQTKDILLINNSSCYIMAKSSESESIVTKLTWKKD